MLPTALATDPVIRSSSGLCGNHAPAAKQEAKEHLRAGLWANPRSCDLFLGRNLKFPGRQTKPFDMQFLGSCALLGQKGGGTGHGRLWCQAVLPVYPNSVPIGSVILGPPQHLQNLKAPLLCQKPLEGRYRIREKALPLFSVLSALHLQACHSDLSLIVTFSGDPP